MQENKIPKTNTFLCKERKSINFFPIARKAKILYIKDKSFLIIILKYSALLIPFEKQKKKKLNRYKITLIFS